MQNQGFNVRDGLARQDVDFVDGDSDAEGEDDDDAIDNNEDDDYEG